jgi:holo-[acyl-carrier protein] synthase
MLTAAQTAIDDHGAMQAIGLDVVEIARLERALERRPRLAERLFTEGERRYAGARRRPGRHLAARFCAKEAAAKALRLRAWTPREIEVVAADDGPRVHLSGAVGRRADELGVTVEVSLTHGREIAAAAALAVPRG